jgi:hypothetical protein
MRLGVLLLCLLSLADCAPVLDQIPRRACLYYPDRRWSPGRVIAKADDGAQLFEFDDSSLGDRGYRWVRDGDSVTIRPCLQVSPFSAQQGGLPRVP